MQRKRNLHARIFVLQACTDRSRCLFRSSVRSACKGYFIRAQGANSSLALSRLLSDGTILDLFSRYPLTDISARQAERPSEKLQGSSISTLGKEARHNIKKKFQRNRRFKTGRRELSRTDKEEETKRIHVLAHSSHQESERTGRVTAGQRTQQTTDADGCAASRKEQILNYALLRTPRKIESEVKET